MRDLKTWLLVSASKRTLCMLALLTLSGCADIKPYERGALAHPTMTTADPTRPGEAHARDVQEGAIGGGFTAGGGCGCN